MTLRDYYRSLLDNWMLIAACTAIAALAAFGVAHLQSPRYRAEAGLAIVPAPEVAQTSGGFAQTLDALTKRSLVATFVEVAQSKEILRSAAIESGVQIPEARKYKATAVALPDANVVNVSLEGPNPTTSARMLRSLARRASDDFQNLYQLYAVRSIDVRTPSTPVAPRPLRDAALGAIIGAAIGFVIGLVRDRALRQPELLPLEAPSGTTPALEQAQAPGPPALGWQPDRARPPMAALLAAQHESEADEPVTGDGPVAESVVEPGTEEVDETEDPEAVADDRPPEDPREAQPFAPATPWGRRVAEYLWDAALRALRNGSATSKPPDQRSPRRQGP
jgi:capsular polysaccharide biosynthesis protein